MDNKIFNLDYQVLTNKLSPLAEVQLTSESMISDSYDSNTKEFLTFITKTIETAKSIEETSIDNNIIKVNALVKDANEVLGKFFNENTLVSYYNDVLSESLSKISNAIESAKESFNVDSIKSSIVDVLKTINASIEKKHAEEFNTALSAFKDEIKSATDAEYSNTKKSVEQNVSQQIGDYLDKNKDAIASKISSSLKTLLCSNIATYTKTLNETFNNNFAIYIENNFKNKSKQSTIVNNIRKTYKGFMVPFVYMAKFIKYTKDAPVGIGTKIKSKNKKVALNPITRLKNSIKIKIEAKRKEIRKNFLKATRFIRRPKKMLQLKFGRKLKEFKKNSVVQTTNKYGLLAGLVRLTMSAIQKKQKQHKNTGSMDFRPFKISSVITTPVEDFIGTIAEHSGIVRSNLQIYLDKDIVESYNSRGVLGVKGKAKPKKGKEESEEGGGGFGLLSFLLSIPKLIKTIKRTWKFIKKTWKFIKKLGRFIKKAFKFVVKAVKAIAKFTVKVGKGIVKGIKNIKNIKNIGKHLKNTGKYLKSAGKAIKNVKNVGKYVKTAGKAIKGAAKGLGKSAAKVGGKVASKGAAKAIPFLSFAVDGAFAAMEAQDTEAMGALYGIDPSEVGVQQKTAYIIAGTLAGGTSLVDADWSDPKSVGMAALDTAMTVGKFAAIGSVIPGVGTAIGAAVGLVVALVGTQRLAKGINWVCDQAKAAWNNMKKFAKGIWNGAKKAAKFIGKAMTWINPILLVTVHGKEIWNGAKNLAKKLWSKSKDFGKKLKEKFSALKNKLTSKLKGFGNKLKEKFGNIGNKLKNSIGTVGKSLLSNLFPIFGVASTVKNLASKTVAKVADKLKNSIVGRATKALWNVFTGKDKDIDQKLEENTQILKSITEKRKDLDTVINNVSSFSDSIKRINEKSKIENSDEESDIDDSITRSIRKMNTMASMIDELFSSKREEPIPIPVEEKPKDKKATTAAKHWWS